MSFPSLFAILFGSAALRRRRHALRWLPALAFTILGLLGSGLAQAAVYNFDGRTIGGCTYTAASKEYSCPTTSLNGNDTVVIASGHTLRINGSFGFGFNQGLVMSGTARLVATGSLSIADMKPSNLDVMGGKIESGGTFFMGAQAQTVSADISANAMNLGTNRITVNGSLTSTTSIAIGSYATINGNVSGTVVTTASPVAITGNVTATTSFSLASGSRVKGTVDTGSLVLESSEALVDGPAYVNTARLEWHGRVSGIIYCKNGTTQGKCDCVTNNSGYTVNTTNGPRCESPAPKAPHHFLVTHDGAGDTCLPEKITVTACANATCTVPHFQGAVSGQLSPFGADGDFTITENTGSVVVNAKRFAEGAVTLGVSNATLAPQTASTCYRTDNTNSCAMNFAGGVKLLVDVPSHAAGTDNIKARLQAVKANDSKTACVAAFENTAYDVQYSCNYSKPKTGTLPLALGSQLLSCAAAGVTPAAKTTIRTTFGLEGRAEQPVKYADAGEVTLNAYVDTGKGMTASGQGSFATVPASFALAPAAGTIRAGADFALTITARNVAGATTPNFDNADLNAANAIKHGVTLDVDCHRQGGSKGTVTPASPAFTDGVASVNATWSDVGHIDLMASLSNFLDNTGLNAAGTTNTAGVGACTGKAGPFIPAYFKVELAGGRTGYYSGEPFPVRVSAMNKAGAVTVNYTTGLNLSEAVTLAANDNTGAAFAAAPGALADASIAATMFVNGVTGGAVALKPKYTFGAWLTAPQQIRLRATNNKAGGLDVVSTAPSSAEEAAMPLIRSGRLRLGSRFGGLKTTLSIPVTAEYWNGRSWVLNSDDHFTAIPHGSFAVKPTVSGMTVARSFPAGVPAGSLKLAGGAASFDLRVTAGGPGPVDVAVNLGTGLLDNACINGTVGTGMGPTPAAIPWLRPLVMGCNPTMARDPSARATFGVYTPENRRIIHVREVFN